MLWKVNLTLEVPCFHNQSSFEEYSE